MFLQKSYRKCGRETSSKPLSVFLKSFIWGKSKWSAVYIQNISITLNLLCNKNKSYKTLVYWSWDMLNSDFSEKVLGIVSPSHFANDFSRKMFLRLYNYQIAWLPLLLRYWAIFVLSIICFPDCDVINFQINLIFLIRPFIYWPKTQDKNLNILITKSAFKM